MKYILVHKHPHQSKHKHIPTVAVANPKFRTLEQCMESYPETWNTYMDKDGGWKSIIKMEYTELLTAMNSNKYKDTLQELLHTAAACMYAYDLMTCDEEV